MAIKKFQYLTIGDFLAWDDVQNAQVTVGSINDTAATPDGAETQLKDTWALIEGKGYKDVRFFGVVYKAEVVRLYV